MKKWILVTVITVLILIGISVNIYLNAVQPKREAESKARSIAKEETNITEISEIDIYHGVSTYYVVQGKNNIQKSLIAWIPEKGGKILVANASDGITKKDAINILYTKVTPEKVIDVKLGMEKNIPLWEIYYRSKNNKINYYYIDFKTGKMVRDIQNL